MTPVLIGLALYLLAGGSGWLIARRVPSDSALVQVLAGAVTAALQIILCMEALALFRQLRGDLYFGLNAAATLGLYLGTRRLPILPTAGEQLGWQKRAARAYQAAAQHPIGAAAVAIALLAILFNATLGYLGLPLSDLYHFEMPLYWRQYRTLTDFPVSNARVTGLAFGSEALCFPAVLYARSLVMFPLLTAAAAGLSLWSVVHLARRMGAPVGAALCAGAVFLAYSPVIRAVVGGSPDLMLSAGWFAGAVVFLLEAARQREHLRLLLGFSVLSFLLACGSKNLVLLLGPVYGLLALHLLGAQLLAWRSLRVIGWVSLLGLAGSTVLWNYTSNYLLYHDFRGDPILKETVSTDLRPRSAWTRIVRGGVGSLLDPIRLPGSLLPRYEKLLRSSITSLGGRSTLEEDSAYYSLSGDAMRPGTGLGPLGLLIYVPALLAGLFGFGQLPGVLNARALALLTIAGFFISFALMRTQSVGVVRLLLPCLILGAPLAGWMFQWRWARVAALGLVSVCLLSYAVFGVGMVSRRLGASQNSWLLSRIAALQRDQSGAIDYRWAGEPWQQTVARENWTKREYYLLLRQRLPNPTVCAFLGTKNSEEFYLFGPDLRNEVYSLRDCRAPEKLLPVPPSAQSLVIEQGSVDELGAAAAGFTPWFETGGDLPFLALKRAP